MIRIAKAEDLLKEKDGVTTQELARALCKMDVGMAFEVWNWDQQKTLCTLITGVSEATGKQFEFKKSTRKTICVRSK